MKKKVLILAHYYYPDIASTASIIEELAEEIQDSFDVSVLAMNTNSYEGYQKLNGVEIKRIRTFKINKESKINRILNLILYFFKALCFVLRNENPDVVVALSQPPIVGGMIGVLIKIFKKSKLIYYVQDVNPEQTKAISYIRSNLIYNISLSLDKLTCRKADLIVTIDKDMANTLNKRFKNDLSNIEIVPNWVDDKKIYPLSKDDKNVEAFIKEHNLEGKYVIMYSGNIGLFYDLENIIKVMGKFKDDDDVAFVFVGEGAMLRTLKNYKIEHQLNNVAFIPFADKEKLNYSLNAADIHLCTNTKGIRGISCPSKFYAIAAINKPVICVMEKDSTFREAVEKENIGYVADPGDYERLEEILSEVIKKRPTTVNSRPYIENSKQRSIKRFTELLNSL